MCPAGSAVAAAVPAVVLGLVRVDRGLGLRQPVVEGLGVGVHHGRRVIDLARVVGRVSDVVGLVDALLLALRLIGGAGGSGRVSHDRLVPDRAPGQAESAADRSYWLTLSARRGS